MYTCAGFFGIRYLFFLGSSYSIFFRDRGCKDSFVVELEAFSSLGFLGLDTPLLEKGCKDSLVVEIEGSKHFRVVGLSICSWI